MVPTLNEQPKEAVVLALETFLKTEKPDVHAMKRFIETLIGENDAGQVFRGRLRELANAGYLPEVELFIEKFNQRAGDEVQSAAEAAKFSDLITKARAAKNEIFDTIVEANKTPRNPIDLGIANNTWTTVGRLHENFKKRRAS